MGQGSSENCAVSYVVCAVLGHVALRDQYVRWLVDDHAAKVLRAGADAAEVVLVDAAPPGPWRVEARYRFSDRGALETYLREHAPALRDEGRRAFGPETGIQVERSVGVIAYGASR